MSTTSGFNLSLNSVSFAYDVNQVFAKVSLNVSQGEIISLVGRSGCGKSTLLRCIGGLLRPTSGAIRFRWEKPLNDRIDPTLASATTMAFQRAPLLPWLTVMDNIILPFKLRGTVPPCEYARSLLSRLGLHGIEHTHPDRLSVGMAQRVALVRSIVEPSPVLLLDEPFSALDEVSKRTICVFLSSLISESRKAVVLVTHSVHDAAFLGDRVHVFSGSPSRLNPPVSITADSPRPESLWLSSELQPFLVKIRDQLSGHSEDSQ